MNTQPVEDTFPVYSHAFGPSLSPSDLLTQIPAAFARNASSKTKRTYRFISTAEVLNALLDVGFVPSAARQTHTRHGTASGYARHMIRLRHSRESITLVDAIAEIVLINAHDGTSAYQLVAGLYRPLCTNGLLCRLGDFGVIRVPHRTNVIADVVAGALQISAQFEQIGATVTAMARRILSPDEQQAFARSAYQIRWAKVDTRPAFLPEKLLQVRRPADDHPTLWHVYNRCQEAAMTGGVVYHSRTERLVRTRPIRNIREDVRINTALWQAATRILES